MNKELPSKEESNLNIRSFMKVPEAVEIKMRSP